MNIEYFSNTLHISYLVTKLKTFYYHYYSTGVLSQGPFCCLVVFCLVFTG